MTDVPVTDLEEVACEFLIPIVLCERVNASVLQTILRLRAARPIVIVAMHNYPRAMVRVMKADVLTIWRLPTSSEVLSLLVRSVGRLVTFVSQTTPASPARLLGHQLWIGDVCLAVLTTEQRDVVAKLIAERRDPSSMEERAYVCTAELAKVCKPDCLDRRGALRQVVKTIRKLLGAEAHRLASKSRCGYCWCGEVLI